MAYLVILIHTPCKVAGRVYPHHGHVKCRLPYLQVLFVFKLDKEWSCGYFRAIPGRKQQFSSETPSFHSFYSPETSL